MADKGTVFQKGGGGTNFEQYVQAAFLATLVVKGNAPCLPTNEVIGIALQTTRKGWDTDDLEVTAKSDLGTHRLLVQIKHNLTFSDKDTIFKEVITAFWNDFNNTQFNKELDRLVIVKSRLNNLEKNHIKGILNYAKNHTCATDFLNEVNRIKEKKDRLLLFQNIITEVNNGQTTSTAEIWRFLKCLDVLGYDLLNEGSVDETYLLNLIKLSKAPDATASERDIWNSLLVFISHLNPNGGNVTSESVRKEEFYQNFSHNKFNPLNKALEKLNKDSLVLLNPLKNTIGSDGNDLHLNRTDLANYLAAAINEVPLTIITGKPGVGKSALTKDVLTGLFPDAAIFAFKADQFNEPHLANVLTNQGISEPLVDLFSWLALIPEKIILIDSLEKLLEDIDPNNAFKQLLILLRQFPEVKIVCTARRYAVDLLLLKYNLKEQPLQLLEIPLLGEAEVLAVAVKFPQLKGLLNNSKIKMLIQTPKYLDFAVKSLAKEQENLPDLTITGFKNMLWNQLVKDVTNRAKGLPAKREDAFMKIALTRAKEMKLFSRVDGIDEEAIVFLENDEIIIQENGNRKYAPAHDILEDWALVNHIDSLYEEYPTPSALFAQLGNEPAIRRAFRLWIEDHLIDDSAKVNEFVRVSLADHSIENYWADEILIAVFKSDNCDNFFGYFYQDLTQAVALVNRSIHLVRTACKESKEGLASNTTLLPIGSGWRALLNFIEKNIPLLLEIRFSIINLLTDWHLHLIFQPEIAEQECGSVKSILLQFIAQMEEGDQFWSGHDMEPKRDEMIAIFFNLSHHARKEVSELVNRALSYNEDDEKWEVKSFYEAVINKCIAGVNNYRLPKEMPDLIIQTAFSAWKTKPISVEASDEYSRLFAGHRLNSDECWGLIDKYQFMPVSIYKTPAYNILWHHHFKGIKFITDLINYAVITYERTDGEYKHEFTKVKLTLTDGTIVEQRAAWELWAAYRGITVTHDLLQCLLVSLEKFLLEVAAFKTDLSRKRLGEMFDLTLRNSNNVAATSVLTSVAMAYPEEVGEAMLPLLGVQEFYDWDSNRYLQEGITTSMLDLEWDGTEEERLAFNKLLHRSAYFNGLHGFVVDYQFRIATINEQIFKVFDHLKSVADKEDVVWQKTLIEIDRRCWKASLKEDSPGTVVIQPEYNDDVQEFMDSGKEMIARQSTSARYSQLIQKAHKKESAPLSLAQWDECYSYYKNNLDYLSDRPVTLANIGLADLSAQLSDEQRNWCIDVIWEAAVFILNEARHQAHSPERYYNLHEKHVVLQSIHLVIPYADQEELPEIIAFMICIGSAHLADYEMDRFTPYFRTTFYEHFPDIAKSIWAGLIDLARFKKVNPRLPYLDQETINKIKQKEVEFIKEIAGKTAFKLAFDRLNFTDYDANLLNEALLLTPINQLHDLDFSNFVIRFMELLTVDLHLKVNYGYNHHPESRRILHKPVTRIVNYLAELLLTADEKLACRVIDLVVDPILASDYRILFNRDSGLLDFCKRIPEQFLWTLDKATYYNEDHAGNKKLIDQFWLIWGHLFSRVKPVGGSVFANLLLLDVGWKEDATEWKQLDDRKDSYYNMVKSIGTGRAKSIVKCLSTIGEKELLPIGLTWLADLIKNQPDEAIALVSKDGERLIKRLFYNHINKIKANKLWIDDYLFLLNKMVDLGSSHAYLFRENVITYKAV